MTTVEIALYLVANAFEAEIIRRSMAIFFHKTHWKILCIFSYFVYIIITFITHWLGNLIVEIVLSAVTIGFITLGYKGSAKRKVCAGMSSFAIINLCDLFVVVIFGTQHSKIPNIMAIVVSKLLAFIIVLIINRFADKQHNNAVLSAAIFVPLGTAALEFSVINSMQSTVTILLSVIIVLCLNAFIFYMYDKLSENYCEKAELAKIEQEREIYYNQCVNLVNSQEELRRFRHDINNQLEVLNVLLDKGENIELKRQLHDLIMEDDCRKSFCNTGNAAVDGILNYKFDKIVKCGAAVETVLEIPCQSFMNTRDLTLILGNLLDNIIDAFEEMQSEKQCAVKIKYSKSCLLIHFKNTYENVISTENGTIVSGKDDKDLHGIGLKSVRDIVNKYGGKMDLNYDGKVFSVKIILLLSPDNNLH